MCIPRSRYDDAGGFFDQIIPPYVGVPADDAPCHKLWPAHPNCTKPAFDFKRLGRRMAAFLISPWVPKNAVFQAPKHGPFSTSQFELSSIPATAKDIFGLPEFLVRKKTPFFWGGGGGGVFFFLKRLIF